jgi:hypothetical protein
MPVLKGVAQPLEPLGSLSSSCTGVNSMRQVLRTSQRQFAPRMTINIGRRGVREHFRPARDRIKRREFPQLSAEGPLWGGTDCDCLSLTTSSAESPARPHRQKEPRRKHRPSCGFPWRKSSCPALDCTRIVGAYQTLWRCRLFLLARLTESVQRLFLRQKSRGTGIPKRQTVQR